ncbi:hypothetical protein LTR85_004643 [Meristemomyces frigidus]|nr:hypothetical protein LTR85_004643 [Meristemomyces frigidus]
MSHRDERVSTESDEDFDRWFSDPDNIALFGSYQNDRSILGSDVVNTRQMRASAFQANEEEFEDFVNSVLDLETPSDGEIAAAQLVVGSGAQDYDLHATALQETVTETPSGSGTADVSPGAHPGDIDYKQPPVPVVDREHTRLRDMTSTTQPLPLGSMNTSDLAPSESTAPPHTLSSPVVAVPQSSNYNFTDREFWTAQVSRVMNDGQQVHGTNEEIFALHPELEDAILLDFGRWCFRKPAAIMKILDQPSTEVAPSACSDAGSGHSQVKCKPATVPQSDETIQLLGTASSHPAAHTKVPGPHEHHNEETLIHAQQAVRGEKPFPQVTASAPNVGATSGTESTPVAQTLGKTDGRAPEAGKVDIAKLSGYLDANLCTRLDLRSDDVAEIENKVDDVAQRYYDALTVSFMRDPSGEKFTAARKSEYLQKQAEATKEVNEALSTDHGRNMASRNCKQLAYITVCAHKFGIPNTIYAVWAEKKSKRVRRTSKLDPNVTCSKRATAVENAIKRNKRLAIDVTEGAEFTNFVLHPAGAVHARIDYCKSNFRRAQSNKQLAEWKDKSAEKIKGLGGDKGRRRRVASSSLDPDLICTNTDGAIDGDGDDQPPVKKTRRGEQSGIGGEAVHEGLEHGEMKNAA